MIRPGGFGGNSAFLGGEFRDGSAAGWRWSGRPGGSRVARGDRPGRGGAQVGGGVAEPGAGGDVLLGRQHPQNLGIVAQMRVGEVGYGLTLEAGRGVGQRLGQGVQSVRHARGGPGEPDQDEAFW